MAQETNIQLEVSDNGTSGWAILATLPAGSTSHAHTGLVLSTTKFYRAKALGGGSIPDSPYTHVASATTDGDMLELFSDSFTGTTIDAAKWDVVNPDTRVTFTQNNKLILQGSGTGGTSSTTFNDHLISDSAFTQANLAATFSVKMPLLTATRGFGLRVDADNFVVFMQSTISDNAIRAYTRVAGVVVNEEFALPAGVVLTNQHTYELRMSGNVYSFYCEGQLLAQKTAAIGANKKIWAFMRSQINNPSQMELYSVNLKTAI